MPPRVLPSKTPTFKDTKKDTKPTKQHDKRTNGATRRRHQCLLCQQTTHEFEEGSQGNTPDLLTWVKFVWSPRGDADLPVGRQCYWCHDTRRMFGNENIGELSQLHKDNAQVQVQLPERRPSRVRGSEEFKSVERVLASMFVTYVARNSGVLYEDGICTGIVRWAKDRGITTNCESDVFANRLQKYFPGIAIGNGTDGNMVVYEIGTYTEGDYKLRGRLQHSKSKVEQHKIDDCD